MINILLVDDSTMARQRIKEIIKQSSIDYTINEAENGVEALKILQNTKINCVITDLEMPQMGGIELTEKIRKIHASTAIIIISSLANEQVKQKLRQDRLADFIKKPINAKQLVNILLKVQHNLKEDLS